ncbi:hypothetical protein D477_005221 [Arthrobacter crystallopoietes BAB-32]|uniref:MarR family transcriptional regulator n=1 Tax=Arthrobacter crystallopoietes BAB-32 TaxID=1246476 RepID=N1V5A5_9MICC|nr:hypothetical protein D477_005221 [Arthrobacter crystallopoietes BAB-32]
MAAIRIKRIYEERTEDDGYRVLVDRLWPRGVSKEAAHLDLWLKEIAPSPELRKEFGHKEDNFDAFTHAYRAELDDSAAVERAVALVHEHGTVTLLYAARETRMNHTVVLRDYLEERLEAERRRR